MKHTKQVKESRCPECMGELALYTKPDGDYIGCLNCGFTEKSTMVPFGGKK